MKDIIQGLIGSAIAAARLDEAASAERLAELRIERPRDPRHGDFSTNAALVIASASGEKPRDVAARICAHLPVSTLIERTEIAGPGFINFFLRSGAWFDIITRILAEGRAYGRYGGAARGRIQVEFVSANPTGPLHIGHGRGAAYGAALTQLLEAAGYAVEREYYVNDAGRQMDLLALSVWLRYLALCGEAIDFPAGAYRGEYVWQIARELHGERGDQLRRTPDEVFAGLSETKEPDAALDALISRCKSLLGPGDYRRLFDSGLESVLAGIQRDLADFGVVYDRWFSERALTEGGAVARALERLQAAGATYRKDGALWFNAAAYGDDKDRVLIRENGQSTYFAADLAYHWDKLERGYDRIIDIWGADHHGYVPRIKAALAALGGAAERLEVLLVQFATLFRGGERVQMSTRSGEFVTLRELFEEVGRDGARFFYVTRRSDQHLDFDLELAKSQSADNPVYYIQYAHARIQSVFREIVKRGWSWDQALGEGSLAGLTEKREGALIAAISRYPELIETAAQAREPHQLGHYLRELAMGFHGYYNAHPILVGDPGCRNARLNLIAAVGQVIRNGLEILGVNAPEAM